MGIKCDTVVLYTSQRDEVVDLLSKEKEYFVKQKFIKEKYGEVSEIFLNAYEWYAVQASNIVQKPAEAESAIWAFMDLTNLDKHCGSKILKLNVPADKAVFFDMADWNKILNMTFVGSEREESAYKRKLEAQGVKFESDIITTSFYPMLKRELYKSWDNLFRYHQRIKAGDYSAVRNIQAGLWSIKERWIDCVL